MAVRILVLLAIVQALLFIAGSDSPNNDNTSITITTSTTLTITETMTSNETIITVAIMITITMVSGTKTCTTKIYKNHTFIVTTAAPLPNNFNTISLSLAVPPENYCQAAKPESHENLLRTMVKNGKLKKMLKKDEYRIKRIFGWLFPPWLTKFLTIIRQAFSLIDWFLDFFWA